MRGEGASNRKGIAPNRRHRSRGVWDGATPAVGHLSFQRPEGEPGLTQIHGRGQSHSEVLFLTLCTPEKVSPGRSGSRLPVISAFEAETEDNNPKSEAYTIQGNLSQPGLQSKTLSQTYKLYTI